MSSCQVPVVFRIRDILIRIRILLFLAVAFKMPTKYDFLKEIFFLICRYTNISLQDAMSLRSHKTVKIMVYLIFLLVDETFWIRQKHTDPTSVADRIRDPVPF
jgi:hypothetical protein